MKRRDFVNHSFKKQHHQNFLILFPSTLFTIALGDVEGPSIHLGITVLGILILLSDLLLFSVYFRAKCIKCYYCGLFFSPNKFIFHSHRLPDSKYVQPDAANFNSWRRHIKLYGTPPDDISFAWEDVKAMFNGGSRKRAMAASLNSVSKQQQQRQQSVNQAKAQESLSFNSNNMTETLIGQRQQMSPGESQLSPRRDSSPRQQLSPTSSLDSSPVPRQANSPFPPHHPSSLPPPSFSPTTSSFSPASSFSPSSGMDPSLRFIGPGMPIARPCPLNFPQQAAADLRGAGFPGSSYYFNLYLLSLQSLSAQR